ncbi:MAG: glycoside hydrolase family 2 TIM barrel-domain containing protein, partial [bacterium]
EKIGDHLGGYSPTTHTVERNLIRYGDTNVIVIKMGGWPSVPRSQTGKQLMVMRGAPWGKPAPSITDGIWLEFFKDVRLVNVKVEPEIDPQKALLKIWVDNVRDIDARVKIQVHIQEWKRSKPITETVTRNLNQLEARQASEHDAIAVDEKPLIVKLNCPKAKKWDLENPNLYEAVIKVFNNGRYSQTRKYRFGFRTFKVRNGRFLLNNKPIMLRGTELYGQSEWYGPEGRKRDEIKKLIIDNSRDYNCNVIRTHTGPIADDWNDVCDEEGMLIFCEFPVTVNFGDRNFTPEEWNIYHEHVIREMRLMIPHYWNRPSNVTWVLTNESHDDHAWELGPLSDFFRKMDPARPLNRSCFNTKEMADKHDYSGVWNGSAGDFTEKNRIFAEKWGNTGMLILNTEYGGHSGDLEKRLIGPDAISMSKTEKDSLREYYAAIIAMEQTECLRLLEYDGIMPYVGIMGPHNRGDRMRGHTPNFKAIRNAFKPVIASVNTLDHHFIAGDKVDLEIGLANDINAGQEVEIIYGITDKMPGYDYNENLVKTIIKKKTIKSSIPAFGTNKVSARFNIPKDTGKYYFLAIVKSKNGTNFSFRPFFALNIPQCQDKIKEMKICLIESREDVLPLLEDLGCKNILGPDKFMQADLVVLGWEFEPDKKIISVEDDLKKYIEGGGRVLVLEQYDWPLTKISSHNIRRLGGRSGTEAFFPKDFSNKLWKGIKKDHLWRFNGQNQAVFQFALNDLPE